MNTAPVATDAVTVAALYRFTALPGYRALQPRLHARMRELRIRGTLILAPEGVNGTVAGTQDAVDRLLEWLNTFPELRGIEARLSFTDAPPFKRARVKLRKEIVTMGVEGIDPRESAGTYVAPEDWNALVDDPEVLVVDTRNEYEIQVGAFDNAVNPHTTNFRDFPAYVKKHLDPARHTRVAMYCTGGIRCEKSTAFLKENGFREVYHLKGGILNYLEKIPRAESRWRGECFVFDDRVTVNHDLEKGDCAQCHACRRPITGEDMQSPHYQPGVSCPACVHERSDRDRERYAERERQVRLAEARGEVHIGPGD